MTYPTNAEIRGVSYPLNTDYREALRCFEVINDNDLCDEERALAVIFIVFGFIPDDDLLQDFLNMAVKYLQCGQTEEQQRAKPADMDFQFDQKYIMASFLSDYRLDITDASLHWWQYVDLINGLTEDCVLSRIRYIRNYDLGQLKDAAERRKMADAKAAVALPVRLTQDERDAIDAFEELFE